jgi:hypothetical protein
MIIKTLVNNLIINKFRTPNEYQNSFSFAILLSYLNINVGNDAPFITHYSSGILIISLIVLICFTNVIGYLSAILILRYYKLSDKYPKLNKIFSYFEKTSTLFIIIEIITGYFFLFMIIFLSLYILIKIP